MEIPIRFKFRRAVLLTVDWPGTKPIRIVLYLGEAEYRGVALVLS
jgi:hypothetical protein